ncbi:MAG: exosortase-associated EpsI family protein, partial [Planctomycetota bacterium]
MPRASRTILVRAATATLTLAIIGGALAERLSYGSADEADPYHRRVAERIANIPYTIGDWKGEDVSVPRSAVELLQPNALCSRQYRNQKTGQVLSLLVVHCRDARDMTGHYPPVCYPAHGWTQRQY